MYCTPNSGPGRYIRIVDCFQGIVAWLGDSMFVWPIVACCENCFVGISYATIGLEN